MSETDRRSEPMDRPGGAAWEILRASVIRQRAVDDTPCPTCGGDRLRTDFTDTQGCHAPRQAKP